MSFTEPTKHRSLSRTLFVMCAVLATSYSLTVSARAQCTTPTGAVAAPTNPSGSFFSNFANSSYEIPIPAGSGANLDGDLNSTYFQMFYSITNLNSWMKANHYCPVELVISGAFPNARYFSVTDNDMHRSATQHLADADIDPAGTTYSNPFTPGIPYTGTQQDYVLPVSLGYVPNAATVTKGCSIGAFEEDNLLDATQRHLSMDWNTNLPGNPPAVAHVVDTPTHSVPNTAGSILFRNYLAPPETCQGTPGTVSCTPPPSVQAPHVIVRDVQTGCAYNASWLKSNNLVYTPPTSTQTPNCQQTPLPAGCGAILSMRDLSAQNVANWVDSTQTEQHLINANTTPQACYANGSPSIAHPLPFANEVVWARASEWVGSPGPDDSYIGAAVSASDLAGMLSGSSCTHRSGDGCVMRFRFQLPAMPQTPCSGCSLTGNEQLRYTSLTFGYPSSTPANTHQNEGTNPEDINSSTTQGPYSLVSLADNAFAKTGTGGNAYVTLIVNVGATLPAWLQQTASGAVGVTGGVRPVLNPNDSYSVWQVQGYTVLDLSQFSSEGFTTASPLLLTIRNTLPGSTFSCSGAAVPFSMAEYTNEDGSGGGLMGPYVPLVDYLDPNTLAQPAGVPSLPSAKSCGVIPNNVSPRFNSPTVNNQLNFPQQYWPSSTNYALNCGTKTVLQPEIYFAATQFTTPATTRFGQTCNTATQPNSCNQIIEQSTQTTDASGPWQPPLPVKIVGTNLGFLPNIPLAVSGSHYLEVSNDNASGLHTTWNTDSVNCQMYIANWTNTSISLDANLPVGITDMYQPGVVLSPLSDVSPLTFVAASPSSSTGCPISSGDHLTFTVTNPQDGGSTNLIVEVSPPTTAPY